MSTTSETPMATWTDRLEAADVILRYGAAIDSFDDDAILAVFDEDATAQYGKNTDVLHGPEAILEFINGFTQDCIWQHHFLNVYRVDVEGDRAKVLVYHTSRQLFERAPDTVHEIVARYHNELRRRDGVWRISKLFMEVLWAERRQDPSRYLEEIGGSAAIWTRA
jgi:ketosteroid isomerase-like protein